MQGGKCEMGETPENGQGKVRRKGTMEWKKGIQKIRFVEK
jgi:hypothetical protein